MKSRLDEAYIRRLFPELGEIKKGRLAAGVVNAWLLAIKRGGWNKGIERIPFTLLIETSRTLVEHTRAVAGMAIAICRVPHSFAFDFDVVVAGALIHDVGKLLEYELKEGSYVKSRQGKVIRHPISGYRLAIEAGLPVAVAHIAASHSTEGEKTGRSAEAILIHHCDFIDFDIAKR